MKNFQSRDNKSGGYRGERSGGRDEGRSRPSYGDKRGGDRGGDREATMFQATCSECKKNCDVPFRPASDKPVYCSSCFSAKREREDKEYKSGSFNREPKRFSNDRPTPTTSFVRPEVKSIGADDSTKKQLADISFKLDKLINVIEKMTAVKNETPVHVVVPAKAQVKVAPVVIAKAKVVAQPHVVSTLRGAKKVVSKVVEVKKSAPKVAEVKKVVAKKVVAKAVVKTVAKKVAVKKTK
ncbi:MAG: CxxC-x17-CxxC domain-containing protein [Candidatus Nomurabacteria bacterium]